MKSGRLIFAIAATIIPCVTAGSVVGAERPIEVSGAKQLFVDELFLATSNGVSLKIRPPRKTGEIVLKSEHPWESATLNWFSVLQDPGRIDPEANYRMWYEAYDVDGWPTGDDTSFCYAESRDGVNWTKPELGLFSYRSNTQNNILFRQIGSAADGDLSRVHGTGIFIDSTAPVAARFKAVSQGIFSDIGKPPHRVAGMYSADGLTWTRYSQPICNVFADSQYSGFLDESIAKYVVYGRVEGQIGRSASTDFSHFEPLESVLNINQNDPENSSLYNSAVIKYPFAEHIYFMFPSLYQRNPDTLDVRLAVSRDGIHWNRPDQTTSWIPLGQSGEFDSGSLYMGQGIIRDGDEISMYYSGAPLRHNEVTLEQLAERRNARTFSRVVMQLDRFIAAVAGTEGGAFSTPPLLFEGSELRLNVNVRQGGSVRVGLLDENGQSVPGRTIKDCIPLLNDSLAAQVRWKDSDDVSFWEKKPIRLQVEMTAAELYGFQFVSTGSHSAGDQ